MKIEKKVKDVDENNCSAVCDQEAPGQCTN